jgi:hypothetical protein
MNPATDVDQASEPRSAARTGRAPTLARATPLCEPRRRISAAEARANEALAGAAPSTSAPALLQAARRARSARQRVTWLQYWGAAHVVAPLAQVAACRRGCFRCCHIAVHITSTHPSLDVDDLLYRLVEGGDVPVPRFDATLLAAVFLHAQPGAVVAEIRGFFGQAGAERLAEAAQSKGGAPRDQA